MEKQLLATRPQLLTKLGPGASWEPVTPLDFFYTDGTAVGSFGKLILSRKDNLNYVCVLYFFPSGDYWVTGRLTPQETEIVNSWIEAARLVERTCGEDS